MFEFNADAPMKVLIEDLKNFEKLEKGWVYKFFEKNISININKILIQGEIVKTSGFSNEILIIHDGTGKAKVTTRPQVPGDISWVNAGTHCSVVGNVVENGKLPLIIADKIAKISNQILVEMWPLEVKELRGVLTKEIAPRVCHIWKASLVYYWEKYSTKKLCTYSFPTCEFNTSIPYQVSRVQNFFLDEKIKFKTVLIYLLYVYNK